MENSPSKSQLANSTPSPPVQLVNADIFNQVQLCCEHNMLDNYTRFELVYEKQLRKELGIERLVGKKTNDGQSSVRRLSSTLLKIIKIHEQG
ncbi:hypothetical protein FDP41_012044 [Naegleria fowleri]|uniref:Uncharacterized protein n=1 Tax=Naegleria fowleri TaxID=5763 RepID=A0A6A5BVU3_NAEFO|nr:uncharacterized protein FDP41_012044 [Naegleria fowleri]KAF0982183.1 hypothetical protein FDP41_012044 [Naegleria fowleri]